MRAQINEIKRMQLLAGILKEAEDQSNKGGDISQEIQALVDKNEFLKGKVKATPSDIIEGSKFVLLFSEDAAKHIAERHLDSTKPGSLFKSGVNLRDVAKKLLNTPPSEESNGRVKWLGANGGNVGEMGVAKATPEEVEKMKDYTMPDGQKEQVKIASGKRKPTSEVSLITAELGALNDGRKALSLITMFPGGTKVDGTEIPMNRGEFASKGLYFVVDSSSPLLKESTNEGQLYHRGSEGTQTLIIPNDLGEIDVDDFTTALEFAIDGEMSERDYEPGTEYNLNVVDQDGDDPTKLVYFKFKQKGEDLEVDPASIRVEMDEIDRLDEIVDKVLAKMRRKLNENADAEEKVYDFLYSDEIRRTTGVTSYETCDEDEWEKVQNYIAGRGINGVTGKASFLSNNEDVTEQEFDKYYEAWVDNIEDQRGYESMNQQDMNWD